MAREAGDTRDGTEHRRLLPRQLDQLRFEMLPFHANLLVQKLIWVQFLGIELLMEVPVVVPVCFHDYTVLYR